MIRTTALAVLVIATPAAPTQTPLVMRDVPDGVYVLTVAGGQATVTPATDVPIGPRPPQPPAPPQPPDPDQLTERAKAVRDAAREVSDPNRPETAANLSGAIAKVTEECGTMVKGYEQISAAVDWMWKKATKRQAAAWDPVKTIVGDELAKLAQDGAPDAAYAKYLGEVSAGLDCSVPPELMMAPNWKAIFEWFWEFFKTYILPNILQEAKESAAAAIP